MASNLLSEQDKEKYQERIYALADLASEIFDCLDFHDPDNYWVEHNLRQAERVMLLQNRVKELEDRLSLTK